jgi:hypothetical protein
MTHHDALDAAMFWTGALLALAPLIFAGIVIGVWWWQRRRSLDAGTKNTRG